MSKRTDILDSLSDLFLNNRFSGYFLRFATEPIPLPLLSIWSIGDLLGFMRGWQDFRLGDLRKGQLKMLTAVIPFFPTIPIHLLIDKFSPYPNSRSESGRFISP